jgi:hypothetical protein
MQVKIFYSGSSAVLENEINKWLEENHQTIKIENTQFTMNKVGVTLNYAAAIWYSPAPKRRPWPTEGRRPR